MIQCSVFIAASVDGFIARFDGDIQWLLDPAYKLADENDFGYSAFIANVDALVMGRGTFEKVLTFDPWPYKTPVIVLTGRDLVIPSHLQDQVSIDRGEPADIVARQAAAGRKHLYIDGGITLQRFLVAGLINELIITRIPILLGNGIPLFGALPADRTLQHVETETWANGFVQSRYRIG